MGGFYAYVKKLFDLLHHIMNQEKSC